MRAERYWSQAKAVSAEALKTGALVPLQTSEIQLEGLAPFLLRRLEGWPPRHLGVQGPKPNPFLPWEPPLEVGRIATSHVLILNKYPVQPAHLLLITQQWQPQGGWLQDSDWQAVAHVAADTGGLWFFNSSPTAGASQPHRHLQLLPRHAGEASCPLAPLLQRQLIAPGDGWPWQYALSPRWDPLEGRDLPSLYRDHAARLALGDPGAPEDPQHAYNLLFDDHWFLTVRRVKEHCAGFSVNGLGFAGFLLCTTHSDLDWLRAHGPWSLLAEVAAKTI
ncbi:MAG: ATP adenylyltransferase [Cyanobacteriota bacterium]|nr:ATP adenylyltransferase [Cyanobacteriota bacterium]